jgi:hypothetical protein
MPGLRQSSAQTLTPRKSGRARVPARREDVCNLKGIFLSAIIHVLGFGNNGSRGRDPSRGCSLHHLLI